MRQPTYPDPNPNPNPNPDPTQVLRPLLKLSEGGAQSPEGAQSPGSQSPPRQHDLGFVKLLVDEIEARQQLLNPNIHPNLSPNPSPSPNPNPNLSPNRNPTLTLTLGAAPSAQGRRNN